MICIRARLQPCRKSLILDCPFRGGLREIEFFGSLLGLVVVTNPEVFPPDYPYQQQTGNIRLSLNSFGFQKGLV